MANTSGFVSVAWVDDAQRTLFACASATGDFFYIAYYLMVGPTPLWEAVFASTLLALANIYALTFVLLDNSTLWMGTERRALFRYFPTFRPGQFRRIMRHASWHVVEKSAVICHQGMVPNGLYLLLEGGGVLERNEKTSIVAPVQFIGEMSFLQGLGCGANATVTLHAESRYVMWDRARLRRQMDNNKALENALLALFNAELLKKFVNGRVKVSQRAAQNVAILGPG